MLGIILLLDRKGGIIRDNIQIIERITCTRIDNIGYNMVHQLHLYYILSTAKEDPSPPVTLSY